MRKWTWLCSLIFMLLVSPLAHAAGQAIILNITGPIGPATQDYIQRGINQAEKVHASAIILRIDTPGGLETSMRGITEAIISSSVPVIAYVTPSGARAASAGVFIMYASHIAAMAPGTNIGAASPVSLLSSGKSFEGSTEAKKAMNDAAAYIRSLAQLRNRNTEWGELAVRQAASLSADEAKRDNVINVIASDYPQLLQAVNGQTVLVNGVEEKLNTSNLQLVNMPQDWRYQFLSFLTDPNVAYILMLIAVYGLFFELSSPGMVLPGVTGVIALVLMLYAFQLMPINYTGLTLMLIGIIFMLFEVYVTSFGIIGIAGVISFLLGSVMLLNDTSSYYHIAWSLIITMSVFTSAFFFLVLNLVFRAHRKAVVSGQEGLIGCSGVVLSTDQDKTAVRVMGEIWAASSRHALVPGQRIRVVKVQGLSLHVEPLETEQRKIKE